MIIRSHGYQGSRVISHLFLGPVFIGNLFIGHVFIGHLFIGHVFIGHVFKDREDPLRIYGN